MLIADTLRRINANLRAWSIKWRTPLLLGAAALFLGLTIWAIRSSQLSFSTLDWRYMALNALILTPAMLILNGAGVSLVGRALGAPVTVRLGVSTAAAGTVAELTPAPGGLVARATVLMAAGARPRPMAQVLTACAGLFIGLAMIAGAISLSATDHYAPAPLVIGAIGAAGAATGVFLLLGCCTPGGTAALVLHRAATLGLALARVWCAFAAVGAPITFGDTPLFVAAAILGALVFIVPAGLGVVELAAAGAAPLAGVSAASAVAAAALNRVLGLTLSALIVAMTLESVSRRDP